MNDEWTKDDVDATIANPIYAGIGPYEATVADNRWLKANVRRIEAKGAKTAIEDVLKRFKEDFPWIDDPDATPYIEQAETDPRAALRRLLTDLRDLVEEKEA